MEKQLLVKYEKRARKFKSLSDSEDVDKIGYIECFPSEGNRCEHFQLYSEDNEIQKEVLQETRTTRIAYSLQKYEIPPYVLQLSTFRPLMCPMVDCGLSLCPSALLLHLQQCHRELSYSYLELTGSISSLDVYSQLCALQPLVPTPVHLFIVKDQLYSDFPVILHMCWLSEKDAPALTSERWLAAWLSCLYIIPLWFRLQFVAYSPTQTSIAYVCKASETRELLTPDEIAENKNIMLIQEKTLARLYSNELSLYVEVNTY